MSDVRFTLFYWPIPFRAQAARYLLAYAGADWEEPDGEAVAAVYAAEVSDQPLPFMGPPLLQDREAGLWLSQLPAVASYLAEVLGLMPGDPAKDALARKVVSDCVDVLEALTLNCGQQMWTKESWADFAEERLPRWLAVFEELGRRHGLTPQSGTLIGTPQPCLADLACASLWISIVDQLPRLEKTISDHAPRILGLSRRIAALPAIAALRADQERRWGSVWCEGEIEESLRSVLADW